jgi:hypothetical protein
MNEKVCFYDKFLKVGVDTFLVSHPFKQKNKQTNKTQTNKQKTNKKD